MIAVNAFYFVIKQTVEKKNLLVPLEHKLPRLLQLATKSRNLLVGQEN